MDDFWRDGRYEAPMVELIEIRLETYCSTEQISEDDEVYWQEQ